MAPDEFVGFVLAASRRAVREPGRIGSLVLTQADGFPEGRLREPEMRHALAQEAESRNMLYGIEVPTAGAYRFTKGPGTMRVAARHDFSLFASDAVGKPVLIELKAGQPGVEQNDLGVPVDCPAISKDFQKLLREGGCLGACMLHCLYAADRGTFPTLLQKYNLGLRKALEEARDEVECAVNEVGPRDRWFVFAILVQHRRNVAEAPPWLFHQTISEFLPAALEGRVCFVERELHDQEL